MSATALQMANLMPDTRQLLSDETERDSRRHDQQLSLLVGYLEWHWRERQDCFIGTDLAQHRANNENQRAERLA